jgi:trans-aconitate methyltransferase
MVNVLFSEIARRYRESSIVQNSAADILFALLNIRKNESVLDVGCGTGNLTRKIYDLSGGLVIGVDAAEGMIRESIRIYGNDIKFQVGSAEDINFKDLFDVIFCNSTLQWIKDVDKAIIRFYRALKKGGRIGVQAPAGKEYSPNFISAIEAVKNNSLGASYFKDFIDPWFFLDTAREYAECFTRHAFKVVFSEIQTIESLHSPEEVYSIFASGAIAGYLNKSYYRHGFDEKYQEEFKKIIRQEFIKQAIHNGKVKLVFKRIYLIAVKEMQV